MRWLSSQQLLIELKQQLKSIYILIGNNFYLLENTQLEILKKINKLYCTEKLKIELDINFDWNKIFDFCKTTSLFSKKKILILNFPKKYPIYYFNKNMILLSSYIYTDLILIILIYAQYQSEKYVKWMQNLSNMPTVLVNCIVSEHCQLETWIRNRSQSMQLVIENLACQLLCYYYEGNHVLLQQILQFLSLVYPDGNLSFVRVKKITNDSAFFDSNHWIESILTGKKKRAYRILKQLEYRHCNWKQLLYKIQCETLIISQIKFNLIKGQSLPLLLNKYYIYTKYHRLILSKIIKKIDYNQLNTIISLLVDIELKYYQNSMQLTRFHFEILTELFCNTNYSN